MILPGGRRHRGRRHGHGGSGLGSGSGATAAQITRAAGGGTAQSARVGNVTVLAPRRVRPGPTATLLPGGRDRLAARPPEAQLDRGPPVRSRATAVLAVGSKAQRYACPRA